MAVTAQPATVSPSGDIRERGRTLLAELTHLQDAMAGRLLAYEARLAEGESRSADLQRQLEALQQAEKQWASERKRLQESYELQIRQGREASQAQLRQAQENYQLQLRKLEDSHQAQQWQLQERITALKAETDASARLQVQWAAERQTHETRQRELERQLSSLTEEHENLKELHLDITTQAKSLGDEWNKRRQAMAGDTQKLRSELDESRKALEQSRERENQWRQRVSKLQDDLTALRQASTKPAKAA
jgi:chromosome segregation ATPase